MKTEILSGFLIPFLGTSFGAGFVLFITVLMKHTEKDGCVCFTASNTRITTSVSTAVFRMLYLAENGFDVYLYEGPGQGGVLRLQNMKFTHKWERPTKAVLSYFKLRDVTIIGANKDHFIMPYLFHEEYDMLQNARSLTLRLLTDKQNAGAHCNVGNSKLVFASIIKWIECCTD